MNTATHGTTAVDWETRVDHDRLRRERVQKLRVELEKSELGALCWLSTSPTSGSCPPPTSAPGRWTS